ncbi:UDP-N-acetylmuramoyl-L-alanyl-D-glutamate--2,6-diaminopimelate ligase [Meiothermus granaticius]|uniref:UDP-N-acetylmuramyl-tripeptide synthetase n=1 Tax=Meiothermus granaticius NBRC 107808 TaxID=1227551 RepID=A0A399F2V5_9DEIN|nr:UDP-N-acetylmuramoyl-L-alanyl-D-glutamate--2,6-diaminopimelate ligase [Meiothermus granaticius]RIH91034.1 UDP-N-acetylmuramoyl-L-alanyl-D-glutamate--2,6-diaminopimelate ligase [Meiothermus granaticius NBRC 107808]GEM85928.1 UDP-N-acetylmuramyl-tripeptide synthetase [Meiothermus granaticius NBRC 107808]
MTLTQLFAPFGLSAPGVEVKGVTQDSRLVQPGFVFVAIPGVALPSRPPLDGHDYIAQALGRGAVAVVGNKNLDLPVPYLQVADARAALADLSAAFWGYPAQKLKLVGVTGSKGKTTVTVLLHHLLQSASPPVGRLSTVGVKIGDEELLLPGHFTTPEAPQVQEMLHRFGVAGCQQAVLEVSSHALALERVRGLTYEVGVFTNLYQDHLDLHGSMENYFAEKKKLLERSRFAVVNSDNPWTQTLAGRPQTWTYGAQGDWRLQRLEESGSGLSFEVISPIGSFPVQLPMLGRFNAENALAALAAASRMGLSVAQLQAGLARFPGVPGRMQLVQREPFRVVVDFAHTGASLEAALQTLRPTTQNRLLVVIGAAGNQDPSRRTGIGQVAARLADLAIFTEEDHRTEPLEAILKTMARAHGDPRRYVLVPDRREAIRYALEEARPGDTVLFSGKGHERTLERGTEVLPWNEVEEVLRALETLGR